MTPINASVVLYQTFRKKTTTEEEEKYLNSISRSHENEWRPSQTVAAVFHRNASSLTPPRRATALSSSSLGGWIYFRHGRHISSVHIFKTLSAAQEAFLPLHSSSNWSSKQNSLSFGICLPAALWLTVWRKKEGCIINMRSNPDWFS